MRFRLPSEAEWEYAALAGSSGLWSFGYEESDIDEYAWHFGNTQAIGMESAQPVGSKRPNRWGLHDMDGNVKEWCENEFYAYLPGGSRRAATAAVSDL